MHLHIDSENADYIMYASRKTFDQTAQICSLVRALSAGNSLRAQLCSSCLVLFS